MSWLVRDLIINSSKIKASEDINSDSYLSLLALEQKIKDLYEKGILSKDELNLIVCVSNTINLSDVADKLGIHKVTVKIKFDKVCNKLAYYLGSYYTDLGYISYLENKYKLGIEDVNKLFKEILKE